MCHIENKGEVVFDFPFIFLERRMMKDIKDVRILVVGDIMLDKYVVGDVSMISPEAPVPIVTVKD